MMGELAYRRPASILAANALGCFQPVEEDGITTFRNPICRRRWGMGDVTWQQHSRCFPPDTVDLTPHEIECEGAIKGECFAPAHAGHSVQAGTRVTRPRDGTPKR